MKKAIISLPKTAVQLSLLLALFFYSFGTQNVKPVYAGSSDVTSCGTLLANAQAQFVATLSANGSVPASPEAKAAADEYIRVSKLCYDELATQNSLTVSPADTSTFIDNDGILLGDQSSAEFVLTGGKWGSSTMGTPGGIVTYSFMGNGLDLSTEPNSSGFGKSVAVTALPNFKVCFITEIQNAFAAWQAVSNIQFVQVDDSNTAFGAAGATGDIRIGAHAFDGPSGTLAHAYFPSSNGGSGTGDMHFDKAESWTCDNSGVNIGVVALHEIGHALGLNHENTSALAVMDPYYNPNLGGLQADDINGITAIYGAAAITATAPDNDNFANANTRTVSPIPYTDTEDTTGATVESTDPQVKVSCDGHLLNKGAHTVWYLYQPGASTRISMDTIGSNYDTYIAVWTGSQPNLTFVACDDDRAADLQSQVVFNAQGGKTYYIEVAGFTGSDPSYIQPNTGGNLIFHANLTNIDVTVATSLIDSYFVPASHEARRSYPLNNGPMKVVNTTTDPTLSSIRVLFTETSYSEMMGLPTGQVSQEYWFPSYNNVNLNSQLRVGNLGNVSTTISVYLGTTKIDSYTLAAGAATRKVYAYNGGPLRVTSSATKILSTIRLLYNNASFSELMGLPKEQLTNSYLFPYYNNVAMTSNLQVSNVGTVATTIKVYLGTSQIDSFSLAAKSTTSKNYAGKNSGPLKVTSSAANIVPSLRVLFSNQSYSEMIGYPGNKLTNEFWYPVYDNATLNSQLRVSNVGTASTIITVYFGTTQIDSYPLAAGAASRKNYKDSNNVPLNGGPLHVVSSSQPILSTVRELYTTSTFSSFYELMGLPGTQLSAQYYFPWYNNSAMDSELRLAMP